MILSLIIDAQNHIYFNLFGQIRIPVLAEWFAFLGRWLGFYERGLVQMTQKTRSGIKELCSRRQCRLFSFFLLVNISSSWVPKLRIDLCWLPSLVWVVYRSNRWKSPAWRQLSYKKNRKLSKNLFPMNVSGLGQGRQIGCSLGGAAYSSKSFRINLSNRCWSRRIAGWTGSHLQGVSAEFLSFGNKNMGTDNLQPQTWMVVRFKCNAEKNPVSRKKLVISF